MRRLQASSTFLIIVSVALAGCAQDLPDNPAPSSDAAPTHGPTESSPLPSPAGPAPITGTSLPQLGQLAEMPGGHVSALEFAKTDPDRLYLASDVNAMGIWRSDDAGASWTRVLSDRGEQNAHQASLAIDPTDEDLVISSDLHGKIWRTTNGGSSWSIVHDNHETTELWTVAISPSNPHRVFVGAQDGSLRTSVDRGATWTVREHAFTEAVGTIAVHPQDGQRLWAGGQSGIHRSLDGGVTWAKIYPAGGLPFPQVVDLSIASDASAFLATTTLGVLRSADGVSWSVVLSGHAHDIAWSASDPRVAYVSTTTSLQGSEDGGKTWKPRDGDLPVQDGRIAVHPTDAARAVFGNNVWQWQFHGDPTFPDLSGEGVFATTNGGTSWQRSSKGFVDLDVLSAAIDPQDPNRIYVGTECSRGLYMTDDGGTSWRLISGGPQNGMWDIAHYAMQFATAPDGTLHMTGRFGYARTDDHGATWTSALDRRHFHGLGINPHDPNIILMGTSYEHDGAQDPTYFAGNHVLRSTDGGKHWSDTTGIPNLPATTIQTFAFDPTNVDRVIVVTSSHDILEGGPDGQEAALGAFRSLDGGRSWNPLDLGGGIVEANGVTFHVGRVFIATDSGVLTSENGGDAWRLTGLTQPTIRILGDVADEGTLYAGTWEGLYVSNDRGETWTRVQSVPTGRVSDLAMDPEGRVLIAVVNDAGVWKGVHG